MPGNETTPPDTCPMLAILFASLPQTIDLGGISLERALAMSGKLVRASFLNVASAYTPGVRSPDCGLISFALDGSGPGGSGVQKSLIGRLTPASNHFPTPFRRLRLDVGPDRVTGYVEGPTASGTSSGRPCPGRRVSLRVVGSGCGARAVPPRCGT